MICHSDPATAGEESLKSNFKQTSEILLRYAHQNDPTIRLYKYRMNKVKYSIQIFDHL